MAGNIYDTLAIARSGILTHQTRMNVIAHNIANVNTPGYHRQQAILGTNPPNEPDFIHTTRRYSLGTGVKIIDITRAFNETTQKTLLEQTTFLNYQSDLYRGLSNLQAIMQASGEYSLASSLSKFWSAWQDVATNPSDLAVRDVLLERAGNVVSTFNMLDVRLTSFRDGICYDNGGGVFTGSVPTAVQDINNLAAQLQTLNRRIVEAQRMNTSTADLMDQRDEVIRQISEKVNISVSADYTVTIGGEVLVSGDGTTLNDLQVTAASPITLQLNGVDVTSQITGGRLGAWLNVATYTDTLHTRLDTMASELITAVNTLHTAGYDLNGDEGLEFFTGTTSADITVNPALYNPANSLLSHPELVAAAATRVGPGDPNPGDGANALAIADLTGALIPGLNNQTFNSYFTTITANLGTAIQDAEEQYNTAETVVNALTTTIQSETGVNLDEEMMDMIAAQRAFQSSARMLTTVDELIQTILNMGAR